MRDAADPVTARESARLADLLQMRKEYSAAKLRRPAPEYRCIVVPECSRRTVLPTVLPTEATGPSTDRLPELVSERSGRQQV
jgi:hypothetical protein